MPNTLPMPQSSQFEHKPTYDALYVLYGVLSGGLNWEIPIHLRGSLEVDQGISVDGVSDFSGNVTFDEDVTIGSAGADVLLVNATATFVNDAEFQGDVGILGQLTVDDLNIQGDLDVDGNTTLGDALTDTTLIAGPATLNATLNVKGNTTLGDAITDTTQIAGPATLDASLNVKGSTTLGDAEADTVTIVDWILQVASNDLLFKDDGGGTVVKICDQSSTYQLDVAIGDFHVSDDAVIGGDLSSDTLTTNVLTANGVMTANAPFVANSNVTLGNALGDTIRFSGSTVFDDTSGSGITLGAASAGRIKTYDAALNAISIPYYNGH